MDISKGFYLRSKRFFRILLKRFFKGFYNLTSKVLIKFYKRIFTKHSHKGYSFLSSNKRLLKDYIPKITFKGDLMKISFKNDLKTLEIYIDESSFKGYYSLNKSIKSSFEEKDFKRIFEVFKRD